MRSSETRNGTSSARRRYQVKPRHNWWELFLVSEACALVFAFTYVIVLTLSLPPTDGAHNQVPFADPLVAPVMLAFAGMAGLLAWPFVCSVLRRRRVRSCLPVILGVTLSWILFVTPFSKKAGLIGSFAAFAAALVFCQWYFRPCQPPGCCEHCGYDLTGNISGKCPECGRPPRIDSRNS